MEMLRCFAAYNYYMSAVYLDIAETLNIDPMYSGSDEETFIEKSNHCYLEAVRAESMIMDVY